MLPKSCLKNLNLSDFISICCTFNFIFVEITVFVSTWLITLRLFEIVILVLSIFVDRGTPFVCMNVIAESLRSLLVLSNYIIFLYFSYHFYLWMFEHFKLYVNLLITLTRTFLGSMESPVLAVGPRKIVDKERLADLITDGSASECGILVMKNRRTTNSTGFCYCNLEDHCS